MFYDKHNQDFYIFKLSIGDPTDLAVLKCIEKMFGSLIDYQKLYPRTYEIPFNTDNKYQVVVHESIINKKFVGYRLLMKGAPEILFAKSSHILINEKNLPIEDIWIKKFEKYLKEMIDNGHRVVAYCEKNLDVKEFPKGFKFDIDEFENPNFPIEDMKFLGMISLIDPPKPNVANSIERCKSAGIKIIMLTGDHPMTAKELAKSIGLMTETLDDEIHLYKANQNFELSDSQAAIVTGDFLKDLNEEQIDLIVQKHPQLIFARISQNQKVKIVESCQRLGELVAVTGDGANDCEALKKADVGIAMGIAGTDICKAAADMILLDDNFATIENAIEESRLIYDNLKKSIAYTLTTKIAELSPFLLYTTLGIPLPIGTIVIILIDLVTEIVPPLSLAFEKSESNFSNRFRIDKKNDGFVNEKLVIQFFF